jgi:predicted RND superfamily exporter protein
MRRVVRLIWILAAGSACAVLFGVGIPLFWVWLASQLQNEAYGAIGMLAVTAVILGPLVTYFVLVAIASRFRFNRRADSEPQRMAWTRSREEIRQRVRYTTTFEEIVLTAVLIVGVGFEVWFFFFAKCSSAACFG